MRQLNPVTHMVTSAVRSRGRRMEVRILFTHQGRLTAVKTGQSIRLGIKWEAVALVGASVSMVSVIEEMPLRVAFREANWSYADGQQLKSRDRQ